MNDEFAIPEVKLPGLPLGRDRHAGASRQCNIISYCAPQPRASRKSGTGHVPAIMGFFKKKEATIWKSSPQRMKEAGTGDF